jgi:hypothetical protein
VTDCLINKCLMNLLDDLKVEKQLHLLHLHCLLQLGQVLQLLLYTSCYNLWVRTVFFPTAPTTTEYSSRELSTEMLVLKLFVTEDACSLVLRFRVNHALAQPVTDSFMSQKVKG